MGKTQGKGRSGEQSLTPFRDPLRALQDLLEALGERGVIIGGIAVSLLGRPRFTADVDVVFLLEMEELPRFLREAAARGIEARIADAETFARQGGRSSSAGPVGYRVRDSEQSRPRQGTHPLLGQAICRSSGNARAVGRFGNPNEMIHPEDVG
ncbi:MAG: hypothetical protein NTW97_04965 [Candidatus Krumholzibacteria bacterium]|nr:hypothetical protein [Candidatus Krumholzibacteria bacterium]